ncbi:mechanosensitive ion channel family protein [Sulfurovum riftiae]|nr:mechanosensitive ion channel family protein [Sulfurovum riftiae]
MQKSNLWILMVWMALLVGLSADAPSWSGKWHVFWKQGAFVVQLEQHGNELNGTYQPDNGVLKGTVEGNTFRGVSINAQMTNYFVFTLSPDRNAFFGNMESGDWVAGNRVEGQSTALEQPVNMSHPLTTMYTFLKLGNQVRNGNFEALERAIGLLSLSKQQQSYYYGKRMALIRKFFQVLDLCTIHKYEFPSTMEGNRTTVLFHQAGTDNTVAVKFLKENSAAGWKIKLPSEAEIDAKLKELLHAYGLEELDPNRNLQLTNPRDTMRTFIEQNERWEKGGKKYVLDTLNLSSVDPAIWEWQAPLLAHYLLGVINRVSDFVYQEIPNNPKSRMPYVYFYHPIGSIVIAPYEIEGKIRWQFTPKTLESIESLYEAMEDVPPKVDMVVRSENDLYFTLKRYAKSISPLLIKKVHDTALWQIILLGIIVLLALFVSYLSKWITFALGRKFYLTKRWSEEMITLRFLRPAQLVIFSLILLNGAHQLGLSDFLFALIKTFSYLLIVVGTTWIFYNLISIMFSALQIHARKTSTDVDEIIISLSGSILRIILVTVALFAVAEVLHIPYKTVLAGLGIGGLAFAIAAKDTIANFFGSAIIIADRPFKTGDRVKIGDDVGVIINVGIRSTKIRTTYDTILTIPNNMITREMIDNYTEREAMRVDTKFLFALDTPKEVLDEVDKKVSEFLYAHPEVDHDKIILTGVNDYTTRGILFELRFFVKAQNEVKYSDIRHRIVTDIANMIKETGIELVFIQHEEVV